jgi:hypothetical protein
MKKFQILKRIPSQPNTSIQIVFIATSADMLSLPCPQYKITPGLSATFLIP